MKSALIIIAMIAILIFAAHDSMYNGMGYLPLMFIPYGRKI